jgi:hypothetical protein
MGLGRDPCGSVPRGAEHEAKFAQMSKFDNFFPFAQDKDGGNSDKRRDFAQSEGLFPRRSGILLGSAQLIMAVSYGRTQPGKLIEIQ